MPAADLRKTLHDPWLHHPTTTDTIRSQLGENDRGDSLQCGEKNLVLERYEESIAKATPYKRRMSRVIPDMHSWAEVLGVDIRSSKTTQRERQRLRRGELGMYEPGPGKWTPSSSLSRKNVGSRTHQYLPDRDNLIYHTIDPPRGRASPHGRGNTNSGIDPSSEVAALDGFLSDLQGRLISVEGKTRLASAPAPSSGSHAAANGAITHRGCTGGVHERDLEKSDLYGVPLDLMNNVMDVRGYYRTCFASRVAFPILIIALVISRGMSD